MAFSSASSTRTPTSTARNHPDPRGGSDSCYFPGCRKDANCHCEICIESFNATRDLHSALRFPSKRKTSKNPTQPFAIDPFTPPTTPEPVSSVSTISRSPPMKSTAKSKPKDVRTKQTKERSSIVGYKVALFLVVVWVLLAVDSGVLEVALKGFKPKLGREMVRDFAEEAKVLEKGLKGRLRVLEKRVEEVVGDGMGKVSNCSSLDSVWKLNQEGHQLFFQWRCVIYRSLAEELSVWGSPLQTSGILAAGVSARSLTILSGRITEWSGANIMPTLRMGNGSLWSLWKWSSTMVQLEKETWVLEYQKSALFQGSGLIQSAWEVLSLRMQSTVKKLKWRLLFSKTFGVSHYGNTREKQQFERPT